MTFTQLPLLLTYYGTFVITDEPLLTDNYWNHAFFGIP